MPHAMHACALLAWMSFTSVVAQAQSTQERLYAKAKEALQSSRDLVADRVVTDMEMMDSDGKSMGTMRLVEEITGWAEGEPVRTVVANSNPEHSAVAKTRFKVIVDNHPDRALRDGTTFERLDSDNIGGALCNVLIVKGSAGKVSFTSRVWIEQSTNLPLKIVQNFFGVPMAKSIERSISYGRSREGAWVPVHASVDATVGVLIHLRTVSKYQFTSWIKRPAQS